MKHGKNPTVAQKKLLKNLGLAPVDWLIVKHTPQFLTVEHRVSGDVRSINFKEDKE